MGNLVGKLLIDEWFKMIALLGFVLVILSLTVELQIDNPAVVFVGAGLFCMGVAEMAMRPYQEQIALDAYNQPQMKISGRMRRINTPGVIFYVLATLSGAGAIARAWVLIGQA